VFAAAALFFDRKILDWQKIRAESSFPGSGLDPDGFWLQVQHNFSPMPPPVSPVVNGLTSRICRFFKGERIYELL